MTTSGSSSPGWNFDNSYARLPSTFFTRIHPVPVRFPHMVVLNRSLATELGLQVTALEGQAGASLFAGNQAPPGAEPLAQAYAGHQFGSFTLLGDGRAVLLGEHLCPGGRRVDIQLKGSGKTPYSRRGDGRAALGPMLREYIVSEAMYALGIPTTRSLAVVTTGEPVFREIPLQGAILTRVAASHLRVGTFEYIVARGDVDALRILADYTVMRHYPELQGEGNVYLALLRAVMDRQAALVSQWMQVGFIHGVMNTDNMSISGETIDYGPCAFMDAYHPETVFSSIDQQGRYAYGNQPRIAQWNLARFAEALLPLLDPDEDKALEMAQEEIQNFPAMYQRHWFSGMRAKLGLTTREEGDLMLVEDLLAWMYRNDEDYINTLRALSVGPAYGGALFEAPHFADWLSRWQSRLERQPGGIEGARQRMQTCNPAVIPRNHLVEEALAAAVEHGDYGVIKQFLAVLSRPYDMPLDPSRYCEPAARSADRYQTFCGT